MHWCCFILLKLGHDIADVVGLIETEIVLITSDSQPYHQFWGTHVLDPISFIHS